MATDWKNPNFVVGPVAEGNNFYVRNDIVEEIWDELLNGNSVLLAAPRRVGKTSIMQYMEKKTIANYNLIFQNIQGISSADEFFERIYILLLKCLGGMGKAKKWFEQFLKTTTITKIGLDGSLEFGDKPINFLKATNALLVEINGNPKVENIVLLLDELPEVLFNIHEKNTDDAKLILKYLRHWRQQPEMNQKMEFVLAGSVGIHYVVDIIEGRNSDLNDLANRVDCKPLSETEASNYIDWATKGATITYTAELKKHLLGKVQYFVPFFVNLLLCEINKQARKVNNPKITAQDIDNAFDTVVKNSDHFKDWKQRLQKYMPSADFDFVNEILIHIAHKGHISVLEVYDKAGKHSKTADYVEFMDDLEKDGYITKVNDSYCFMSPFLSAFWKRINPIYNG